MTLSTELRGAVLGRGYRLEQRLGPGGDAAFEATHQRLPGKLVVWLFPIDSLSRPDASARIQRGACFGSLVRDRQAIQILDFNLAGDTPAFVVTERIEGRSLADVVADNGMLSLPATAEIVASIALACAAAHQVGVTHGDLRPFHVVLPDGAGPQAKVGGFGWAKELRAVALRPGAGGFLAPEQKLGSVVTVDPRTDQFGLAALAYELLAGCLPFSEEGAAGGAIDGRGRPRLPSPLGELVPGIPKALDDVIRRALAAAPGDRFDDIRQFAAHFAEAATAGSRTAASAAAASPTFKRAARGGVRSTEAMPRAPAALPTIAASDVTEEMDVRTLWPLVAKADSGGNVSARIQNEESLDLDLLTHVAREKRYDVDIEIEVDADLDSGGGGGDDRASRTTGPSFPRPTSAPTSARGGEAQTQVSRSPFSSPPHSSSLTGSAGLSSADLDDPDDALDELSLRPAPPRPLAVNLGSAPGAARVGGRPIVQAGAPPPRTSSPRLSSFAPIAFDDVAAANELSVGSLRRGGSRKWTVAAAGVALLAALLGGGVVLKSRLPAALGQNATAAPRPTSTDTSRAIHPPGVAEVPPIAAIGAPIVAPVRPMPAETTAGPRSNGYGECAIKIASTPPAADVWIDGKNTGRRTPLLGFKVPCGLHRLLLHRADTGTDRVEILKAMPGRPFTATYPLE